MGPGGFFPTNPDLADILGDTDFDFENVYFFDFVGSQISGLGPAWAQLGPPAWARAWAQLGPGLGPTLARAWARPWAPRLGPPRGGPSGGPLLLEVTGRCLTV